MDDIAPATLSFFSFFGAAGFDVINSDKMEATSSHLILFATL